MKISKRQHKFGNTNKTITSLYNNTSSMYTLNEKQKKYLIDLINDKEYYKYYKDTTISMIIKYNEYSDILKDQLNEDIIPEYEKYKKDKLEEENYKKKLNQNFINTNGVSFNQKNINNNGLFTLIVFYVNKLFTTNSNLTLYEKGVIVDRFEVLTTKGEIIDLYDDMIEVLKIGA